MSGSEWRRFRSSLQGCQCGKGLDLHEITQGWNLTHVKKLEGGRFGFLIIKIFLAIFILKWKQAALQGSKFPIIEDFQRPALGAPCWSYLKGYALGRWTRGSPKFLPTSWAPA